MGSQTSGSITFDTSSLAAAVVKGLEPVLGTLNASLAQLAVTLSPNALSQQDAAATLLQYLPDSPHWQADHVARFLAEELIKAGFILVRVQATDLVGQADLATEELADMDDWFARDGRID